MMIYPFADALAIAGVFALLPGLIMARVVLGPQRLRRRISTLRPMLPKSGVSLWKNERKKRGSNARKGGYQPPDALYDSRTKLHRIPP